MSYLPLDLFTLDELEVFPLPGFKMEANALQVGNVLISRPNREDWESFENSNVIADKITWMDDFPFFAFFGSRDNRLPEELRNARSAARKRELGAVFLTLRLMSTHTLYSFEDFMHYSVNRKPDNPDEFEVKRSVNHGGRAFYEMEPTYILKEESIPYVGALYDKVCFYLSFRENRRIDNAIDLFNASYRYHLSDPVDQLLVLLGAIESLVGHSDLGNLTPKWPTKGLQAFAAKFKTFRNALAHGLRTTDLESLAYTRHIASYLLSEALARELEVPSKGRPESKSYFDKIHRTVLSHPIQKLLLSEAEYTEPAKAQEWSGALKQSILDQLADDNAVNKALLEMLANEDNIESFQKMLVFGDSDRSVRFRIKDDPNQE